MTVHRYLCVIILSYWFREIMCRKSSKTSIMKYFKQYEHISNRRKHLKFCRLECPLVCSGLTGLGVPVGCCYYPSSWPQQHCSRLLSHGPITLAMCTCVYAPRASPLIGRATPWRSHCIILLFKLVWRLAADTREASRSSARWPSFPGKELALVHVGACWRTPKVMVHSWPGEHTSLCMFHSVTQSVFGWNIFLKLTSVWTVVIMLNLLIKWSQGGDRNS